MDDLDFSKPPLPQNTPVKSPSAALGAISYDKTIALKFFQIAGRTETFEAGKQIFAEQDKQRGGFFSKGVHVYLLLDGEVALTRTGRPINLVLPGEIFGELAVISDAPRSATATARKNCRVLSLDEKQFRASLQQLPEFAFMLISILAQRLHQSTTRLLATKPEALPLREGCGLDKSLLADLRHAMGDPMPTPMKAGDAIVTKGAVGVSMFVVTDGRVSIAVDGRIVESIGAGETFGETALLGPSIRAASVTAKTDGAWLPVTRDVFLKVVRSRPAFGVSLLRSMSERIHHISALLGA